MKIEIAAPDTVSYSSIEQGEAFLCENEVYIKTDCYMWSGVVINAVFLSNGTLRCIDPNEQVIPIKTKVIIDNER